VSVSIEAEALAIENPGKPPTSGPGVGDWGQTSRTRLLESSIGLVEDARGSSMGQRKSPEHYSPDFQVCLPYRGLFVWHVGDDDVVGDANQVLFVTGGESFRLSQPVSHDYAELIITPDPEFLTELAGTSGALLPDHPLFRRRSRRAEFHLQQLRTRLLHAAELGDCGVTAVEELVARLLRLALDIDPGSSDPSSSTRGLIRRTKEYLEANLASPIRLADVALAVGASPAYLTDVFRRVEGIPLHRYLTQLRLARGLIELQHAHDLTALALGLGFSSHSHFSAAFRQAFGCTPSKFRESTRQTAP
jgi:AraC family transcriptional regulator